MIIKTFSTASLRRTAPFALTILAMTTLAACGADAPSEADDERTSAIVYPAVNGNDTIVPTGIAASDTTVAVAAASAQEPDSAAALPSAIDVASGTAGKIEASGADNEALTVNSSPTVAARPAQSTPEPVASAAPDAATAPQSAPEKEPADAEQSPFEPQSASSAAPAEEAPAESASPKPSTSSEPAPAEEAPAVAAASPSSGTCLQNDDSVPAYIPVGVAGSLTRAQAQRLAQLTIYADEGCATDWSASRLQITWQGASDDDLGYYVYYGDAPDATTQLAQRIDRESGTSTHAADFSPADDFGYGEGDQVCFTVSAFDDAGESDRSDAECILLES